MLAGPSCHHVCRVVGRLRSAAAWPRPRYIGGTCGRSAVTRFMHDGAIVKCGRYAQPLWTNAMLKIWAKMTQSAGMGFRACVVHLGVGQARRGRRLAGLSTCTADTPSCRSASRTCGCSTLAALSAPARTVGLPFHNRLYGRSDREGLSIAGGWAAKSVAAPSAYH